MPTTKQTISAWRKTIMAEAPVVYAALLHMDSLQGVYHTPSLAWHIRDKALCEADEMAKIVVTHGYW